MGDFVENIRKTEDKTSVWYHFLKSKTKPEAKCKYCNKVLLCAGGSTSALRNHLKNKHIITFSKDQEQTINQELMPSTSNKKKKITEYLTCTDSMELTVARMVTLDGIPFRVFANSVDLRRLFKKSNLVLPSSANTIKNIAMKCNEDVKVEVKRLLEKLKKDGQKFSITADEWTSTRNRRYLNINIHTPEFHPKQHISLGLIRLEGAATSIKCTQVLEKRLLEFNLSLEDDVVGLTTDGAAVMVKMGKCLPIYHQLCYAHAIQLAVLDLLYKKDSEDNATTYLNVENSVVNLSDSDDDEEDGVLLETENRHGLNFSHYKYKDLIQRVRTVVKIFRKSATKNDEMLQKYVKEKFNQDMCVILDCKTRWSSLCDMVDRFLVLYECIQKALLDLKSDIRFTDSEIASLRELKQALEIVKGVVEVLCLEDATLLTADTAFRCMFNKLSSMPGLLSFELQSALKKRLLGRYLLIQGVLKYLNNAQEYFEDDDSVFQKPTSDFIKSIVAKIVTDDHDNIPLAAQMTTNINTDSSSATFKTFKEELMHALKPTKSCTAPTPSTSTSNLEIEKMVLCEMALHENGGGRGSLLTKAYKALITIKPTSVESERAFSTAGYFCSKIRSRLNDETLNALLFLRSHFLTKKL